MMYNTPLRLTTLHFEQRFLIEEVTFTIISPSKTDPVCPDLYSQSFDYTSSPLFRIGRLEPEP
jgi:hypothetical protein